MKSIHFCTPEKLHEIKTGNIFTTWRTGWIPNIYPGDTVQINERTGKDKSTDIPLFMATVTALEARMLKDLPPSASEEVARYHKRFSPYHYFICITFEKMGGKR